MIFISPAQDRDGTIHSTDLAAVSMGAGRPLGRMMNGFRRRALATAACVIVLISTTATQPAMCVDALGNESVEPAALTAAELEEARSQWRYTSQGWRHVDDMRVRKPTPEWSIDRVHPLVIVMFEILAACPSADHFFQISKKRGAARQIKAPRRLDG